MNVHVLPSLRQDTYEQVVDAVEGDGHRLVFFEDADVDVVVLVAPASEERLIRFGKAIGMGLVGAAVIRAVDDVGLYVDADVLAHDTDELVAELRFERALASAGHGAG